MANTKNQRITIIVGQ